ncbi:MAG: HEPN domain-containing protein [Clostridiales bacterium]|nr:HEPN domain-containing protein [Clostridiales bacterium]
MGNNELYQEWMKYAVADSTAAAHLTNHHPVQLEIVCYHCQQAGEKALKAILAYHNEQIPRTHNLYELLKTCVNYFPKIIIDLAEQADRLTNFAVITRYPNDEMDVEIADMEQALMDAEHILSYVTALFAVKDAQGGVETGDEE